ncbi:MAG: tRNA guanosine(34) transglycosylase Tgt [Bacteroidetes bacterium]|jgi:queuine tRNA-ribosyltransferase|nr:tRNA guanosine(34) transglycosylase Tgt [Bacteroidota bacterium]
MKFELLKSDTQTKARAGVLQTGRGVIETPIFMPVGTQGTVKAVNQTELKERVKAQIILANTYHVFLRPGLEVVNKAGGIHKFINWDKPMLTDSGGYQVFSLSEIRKIHEEGVYFRSHLDGAKIFFTPEIATDIQRTIGADIFMAFDECPPYPCDHTYAKTSMQLTHRWLQRCITRFNETEPLYGVAQNLFPIVQGSIYKDLRIESAQFIADQNMNGNAIGGLSVGEPAEQMYEMTELVCDILPKDKPRYLMGVGTPENILECIALGIDMFDCVLPTRNARHGYIFTSKGIINIKNEKWKLDYSPLDDVFTPEYSKAYLRHLIRCNEILGFNIASIQNLSFYLWLVQEARKHILEGDFLTWKKAILPIVMNKL